MREKRGVRNNNNNNNKRLVIEIDFSTLDHSIQWYKK